MKLCTKCKHLHNDEDTVCSNCNSPLESITDENTPVYLLSAEGFELERVKTALEDNSIPCDSVIKDKQLKKQELLNKNSAVNYSRIFYFYKIFIQVFAHSNRL